MLEFRCHKCKHGRRANRVSTVDRFTRYIVCRNLNETLVTDTILD